MGKFRQISPEIWPLFDFENSFPQLISQYNTIEILNSLSPENNMRDDKYKYDNSGKHVCVVPILFQIMITF